MKNDKLCDWDDDENGDSGEQQYEGAVCEENDFIIEADHVD